ncbi:MAG: hypothetical protein WD295_00350, partial [Bacteroidota bacterium]
EDVENLQFRWTTTQINNASNYRMDDFTVRGVHPLQDGDGSAVVLNDLMSSNLLGSDIFPANVTQQPLTVMIQGYPSGTLTKVSVTIPHQWGWTGSGNDVAPDAEDDASLSNEVVSGSGTMGDPYVITYDAALTTSGQGQFTIQNLSTLSTTAITDNGNFVFVVKTAKSGGALTPIQFSPTARVIIPIANVKDVDADGVPLDNNTIVAVSGVATVSSGVFASHLDAYIEDAGAGINVWRTTSLPISEGHQYIVRGVVSHFNGLIQIGPNLSSDVIDEGSVPAVTPFVATIDQLLADPEAFESRLVEVRGIARTGGTWPTSSGSANGGVVLNFSDGSQTVNVFIDYDTGIDGNPEPVWPKDVIGIVNQVDGSSPYLGDATTYRIAPRGMTRAEV